MKRRRILDGTAIVLSNLSYQDEGMYKCEARDLSIVDSPWVQATAQLELLGMKNDLHAGYHYLYNNYCITVTVETVVNPRITSTIVDQVILLCAMTDYIRPDEQFQWFRGSDMIDPTLTEKYSVEFGEGPLQAQNGLGTLSPGRFVALFITDPGVSDTGMYTCAVGGAFAIVELIVNGRLL